VTVDIHNSRRYQLSGPVNDLSGLVSGNVPLDRSDDASLEGDVPHGAKVLAGVYDLATLQEQVVLQSDLAPPDLLQRWFFGLSTGNQRVSPATGRLMK
jgi:hypothetical protein